MRHSYFIAFILAFGESSAEECPLEGTWRLDAYESAQETLALRGLDQIDPNLVDVLNAVEWEVTCSLWISRNYSSKDSEQVTEVSLPYTWTVLGGGAVEIQVTRDTGEIKLLSIEFVSEECFRLYDEPTITSFTACKAN